MTGRRNNPLFGLAVGVMLFACSLCAFGQDRLPLPPVASRPVALPEEAESVSNRTDTIPVGNSMPALFRHVEENRLEGGAALSPFWEKLRTRRASVRIVHVGDSHVRGHVFPLVVRRNFERDFGREAVYPDTITYRTSGLARETGMPGVVYHMIGVNGATCHDFATAARVDEIAALHPDLVILSFGTNESHGRGYAPAVHEGQMDELTGMLHRACPDAVFLLTTPPGSYVRYRRGRQVNTRTPLIARTVVDYAHKRGYAAWDLFTVVGGKEGACRNWVNGNYMVRDRIHYTVAGYTLQGNLFYEALIKAYNEYVSN